MTYYLPKVYFHLKIQLLVTEKSDQDPDPLGSALVWLPGSGSRRLKNRQIRSGFGCPTLLTAISTICKNHADTFLSFFKTLVRNVSE
jgi:hypothetical protein